MVIHILNGVSPFVLLAAAVVQFQKQGKDMEKVKQRLAEIANYVDKVSIQSPEGMKCRNVICSGMRSILRINWPASIGWLD